MGERRTHSFIGKIYKVGIIRCVDVPKDVSDALGDTAEGKYTAVRGSVSGIPLTATLVPRGRKCFKMFLHSRIWRKLRVDSGDFVEIAFQRDDGPHEPAVPEDLAAEMAEQRGALGAYRSCTTALRREFVNWVNAAKSEKTREKRIRVGMRMLEERRKRGAKRK